MLNDAIYIQYMCTKLGFDRWSHFYHAMLC